MATTKKEGAPARERPSRSSLTPTTMQNPRARATKPSPPATSSSEKETAAPTSARARSAPNYLRPTFSSSLDAAKQAKAPPTGTARASQRTVPGKKVADAKSQPQRSSSFNPPRGQKPALSSRSSFSERTPKGKASPSPSPSPSPSRLSLKVDVTRKKPSGVTKSKCSSTASSVNGSTASSPKTGTDTDTLSNEDREAALDILNLDVEEHVLLEVPPVVDKTTLPEEPVHVESDDPAEELTAFAKRDDVKKNPVVPDVEAGEQEEDHDAGAKDGSEEGKKENDAAEEKDDEEAPTEEVGEKEDAEKLSEADEKPMVEEGPGSDGEDVVEAKGDTDDGGMDADGVDGGEEEVEPRVNDVTEEEEEAAAAAAAETEEEKEAPPPPPPQPQPQQGKKKDAPPAYNDVIEETASKLVEKRKSKVKALVGAFETVIVMDSGGQNQ